MSIHIIRNGQKLGPYEEVDVLKGLLAGIYSRDDLAWKEGMADWQSLGVLYPIQAPPPPPAQQAPRNSSARIKTVQLLAALAMILSPVGFIAGGIIDMPTVSTCSIFGGILGFFVFVLCRVARWFDASDVSST